MRKNYENMIEIIKRERQKGEYAAGTTCSSLQFCFATERCDKVEELQRAYGYDHYVWSFDDRFARFRKALIIAGLVEKRQNGKYYWR